MIEPPKPKVWPDAFGVDRTRVRLKQGQTEKLKGFFLPFTMTSHYATVVFKDKEQGEFVYEMVGEAGLPPPCMEQKVSAHARCMHGAGCVHGAAAGCAEKGCGGHICHRHRR